MRPFAPSKRSKRQNLHVQRAQLPMRTGRELVFLCVLLISLNVRPLWGQVGNDNPTGPSGIFNGNLENTGVDPWTANAIRSITDISVAGAVGAYPLALVRTANSRAPSTTEVFGFAGGWNHNYNWIMEDSTHRNNTNYPTSYTVDFPDGRVETFTQVNWDTVAYRVRATNGNADSSAGVRERLVPIYQQSGNLYADLILPDGGKVHFQAWLHTDVNGRYFYRFRAIAIIDPYGLTTTLQWEVVGPQNNRHARLAWVIEPAGRYLHFLYTGPNSWRIDHVDASDGRTVQYYYQYCPSSSCQLSQVRYYNNPAWDAHYQYTGPNVGDNSPPLLKTCDDPMFAGPMKRISYEYKTGTNDDGTGAVYGQVYKVRYWDGVSGHENSGAVVSTLAVGSPNNNRVYRTETRGDGATRTFIYNGAGDGYLAWASDFSGRYASQGYDSKKYINSVTDRRGNTINYTNDPITGKVTQIQLPLTQSDTPGQTQPPTINYTYTNNYYLHTVQGENGQTTSFTRDPTNNRVTRIDYPDSGYETFSYDAGHFYQISSHRLSTGGTETFSYDASDRLQYYSDAYHTNPGNPSIQYFYDTRDRVSGILDALSNPTNWQYNERGQVTVTTLPPDPFDNNTRHTITNVYNADGTLQSKTDALGNVWSYTYDDYRRIRSVTTPGRGDGGGGHTTTYFYDANGVGNDYTFTDSNVTWIVLPSGKKTKNVYDVNRFKTSVTIAPGTSDELVTTYQYDAVGNLIQVTNPRQMSVVTSYDERNRPSSINDRGRTTTFTYDTSGRLKTTTRPNGQVITNETFDAMNRVTRQRVTQTPEPDAVTNFDYYASGPANLLHTMQDPRLVQLNNAEQYTYEYDLMGRKKKLTYPKDDANVRRTEQWSYDAVGQLQTFTNRAGNVQTFEYDPLNRMKDFYWDDGVTPRVDFTYDPVSRLTDINNANAAIHRIYWNDGLLRAETETITGAQSKTVQYTYDADGNRSQIWYPDGGLTFAYSYNGRNQLSAVNAWANYIYDENGYKGDLTTRSLTTGQLSTSYTYDALDRVTWVTHSFTNNVGRWFNYGYQQNTDNRKFVRRWNGQNDNGDIFAYDLADQVIGVQLNVVHPDTAPPPRSSITYDPNGNRTAFNPYAPPNQTYAPTNNLNQYVSRTIGNTTTYASYDYRGNMTQGLDGSTYTYDAQNRLTQATRNGVTMSFTYDGLNRQVRRVVTGGPNPGSFYSVWDGWDLIEEYQRINGNWTATSAYVYGATGLIAATYNGQVYFHFQDASGSTSHLTDASGVLREWYRYDLQGAPMFYDANNNQLSASAFGVRHLFTGQQWYPELGLYDLRNRFYSPDLGRFLQPDPIGFWGGTNLYRYCRNNPVMRWDPFGLLPPTDMDGGGAPGGTAEVERVTVQGSDPNDYSGTGAPSGAGPGGGGGPGEGSGPGGRGRSNKAKYVFLGRNIIPADFGPNGEISEIPTHNGQTERVTVVGEDPNRQAPRSGLFTISGPWDLFSGGPSWAPFWRFVFSTDATPEQKAWTDTGRIPTLVATGIVFLPAALPESFAELAAWAASTYTAAAATAQAAQTTAYSAYSIGQYYVAVGTSYVLTHPQETRDFVENAAPGMGPFGYTTWSGFWGAVTGQIIFRD